jgi:hypothetical protein
MTIQDVRSELSTLLDDLDAQSYDYLPGSAQLPAIVVGLPERIDHAATSGYWRIEIPVFAVTRSADPKAGETDLLDLVAQVVALLKSNTTGTTWASLKVVDTTDLYQITVGTIEAHSASINLSLMIPAP